MTKRLIFCFDGTDNDPNDAKPEKEWFGLFGSKDNGVSNVFKLHLYFGGDLNINGAPVGRELGQYSYKDQLEEAHKGIVPMDGGSMMMVVAVVMIWQ